MRTLLGALAGLALLRAAGALAAAEPFSPPQGDAAQSTACDRHMAVQRRLVVVEEVTAWFGRTCGRHHQGAEQQKKCERQAAKSQKGEDGREDRGAPGDRGERPVGPAGGAGLEPAPRTLQPGPRPPRRRWLLSPGAGAQQLEVVPLPGSTL
ncbi:placenta-specific protein 9 isoform X6 [Callithrix jacchus]|uniref:placenta-specific protein 9 isoform X6 n=1 Tax=Callithrix jacchus TaxID=9483 RepID=UPI00159D9D6D|nr:placenta-specific protein 9 isoform X6 [Callithrix jacchus]